MKKFLLTLAGFAIGLTSFAGSVTFNFVPTQSGDTYIYNPENCYGLSPLYPESNSNADVTYLGTSNIATEDNVTISFDNNTSNTGNNAKNSWRLWSDGLRCYGAKSPYFTISTNNDENITYVSWTLKSNGLTITPCDENKTTQWTGSEKSVTFQASASSTIAILTITVGYGDYSPTDPDPSTPTAPEGTISCAEAISYIDNGYTGEATVKGYITSIVPSFNEANGYISYWIADKIDGGNQFEVYNGLSLNGEKFVYQDAIAVGALVEVTGNLTKYNSTYELAQGNKLKSYTGPNGENAPSTVDPSETGEKVTFNFVNSTYGIEGPTAGSDDSSQPYTTTGTMTDGNIVIELNGAEGKNNWRFWNDGLRAYSSGSPSFTVTSNNGATITKIKWTTKSTNDPKIYLEGEETTAITSWSGSESSVSFIAKSSSGGKAIATMTVYYEGGSETPLQEANLKFSETTVNVEGLSGSFTVPTLSKDTNASLSWASSNEKVATVSANGNVTITGYGSTKITVSAEANDEYAAGSASYTLNVLATDVITVAKALELIENGYRLEATVAGVISKVGSLGNSGGLNYWISDADSDNELYVYYGLGLEGAKFTAETDVLVGAKVVINGTLTVYNSTPEFAQNSEMLSYDAEGIVPPVIPQPSGDVIDVAEALYLIENGYRSEATISGIISNVGNLANGKLSYYISDADADNELYVYNGLGLENAQFESQSDVLVGAKVTVKGTLTLYNTTPELTNSVMLAYNADDVEEPETPELTAAEFDFTDPTGLTAMFDGEQMTFNGEETEYNMTNVTIVEGPISITGTAPEGTASSSSPRLFYSTAANNGGWAYRFYNQNSISITAAEGCYIYKIDFTATNLSTTTVTFSEGGSFANNSWTANEDTEVSEVVITKTSSGNTAISKMIVYFTGTYTGSEVVGNGNTFEGETETATFDNGSSLDFDWTATWNQAATITFTLTLDSNLEGVVPQMYIDEEYAGDFTQVTSTKAVTTWEFTTAKAYSEDDEVDFAVGFMIADNKSNQVVLPYTIGAATSTGGSGSGSGEGEGGNGNEGGDNEGGNGEGTTAIDSIDAQDVEVEYYTLQGIKVQNPAKGQLYIMRQGNKTSKVILK